MVDQLVDVTDIKGFEINDELDDQIIGNVSLPEKFVLTKDKPATQNPATTRDKPHKPAMTSNKPVMTNTKPAIKPDTTTDGRNHVTGRSNKSAFLQRSERVDEIKEMKQEESDVHKDGITNESKSCVLLKQSLCLLKSRLHYQSFCDHSRNFALASFYTV
jgi:hypothetical protein